MLSPEEILEKHAIHWKIEVHNKVVVETSEDLALYYTPGVALPCLEIEKNPELAYDYTRKANTIAIVSDWTAVLGLWNIGWLASMPVMEGKSMLVKRFAGINCIPLVLNTQVPEEIIKVVDAISPGFGGIILEDIAAPQCFMIEAELEKRLNIPVFHDDQHGTAIVILGGLINALKLLNKNKENIKVVIAGAGAGGIATGKLLAAYGCKHIIFVDSKWSVHSKRDNLHESKQQMLSYNITDFAGSLEEVIVWADVFIGLSGQPWLLNGAHIKSMNPNPIIFTVSNPNPEVDPALATQAGASIVATGRSDFPNQLNNLLIFPGLFRGLLTSRAKKVTTELKLILAEKLASLVSNPSTTEIIPSAIDDATHEAIFMTVKSFYNEWIK